MKKNESEEVVYLHERTVEFSNLNFHVCVSSSFKGDTLMYMKEMAIKILEEIKQNEVGKNE